MGRKKKSAAEREAAIWHEANEIVLQIVDSIDAEDMRKAGEAARVASLVAVKWAHSRFAAEADKLAAIVDGVCRGQDSLTPEDVGDCLKETTQRLEHLKAVTDNADAVFVELAELSVRVDGLDE